MLPGDQVALYCVSCEKALVPPPMYGQLPYCDSCTDGSAVRAEMKRAARAFTDTWQSRSIPVNGASLRPADEKLLADCIEVLASKGADYTAGHMKTDRLHNFRTIATELGVPMEKAWFVYFYKHYASIVKYVKEGQVESEPIRGRIVDCINYLVLLNAIIEDGK